MGSVERSPDERLVQLLRDHSRRVRNLEQRPTGGGTAVPSGTSPPASPSEGEVFDWWPSGTVGTGACWRLTRRGSTWVAQGAEPLTASADAEVSTTSTTFVDGSLSIAIPRAGTYIVGV